MQKNLLTYLSVIILSFGVLTACSNNFIDATPGDQVQSLPTPKGNYRDVAWLTDEQIAFLYSPTLDPPGFWDYEVALYTLHSENWKTRLTITKPEQCFSAWMLQLARLPNNKLGYLYRCSLVEAHASIYTLYMWDQAVDTLHILQRYPQRFSASRYTFSPDLTRLIQEEQGGGLKDKLFWVSPEGTRTQLFPDYQRVRSPSWSPAGNTIAFVGTDQKLKARTNPFTALVGIGDVLFYPWDLYLMDADGSNLRLVLGGIQLADRVKWSPQGRWVAFTGRYEDRDGIWIFDTNTSQVTRIWAEIDDYDWSPDGRQMIILEQIDPEELGHAHPVVINVPIFEKE